MIPVGLSLSFNIALGCFHEPVGLSLLVSNGLADWIIVDFQDWLSIGIEIFMISIELSLIFNIDLIVESRFP